MTLKQENRIVVITAFALVNVILLYKCFFCHH